MKTKLVLLLPVLLALTLAPAGATVRYVNLANPSPALPYTTWASAATNIQDAIDAATAGDEVVVTNGVYATGGRVVNEALLLNRVAVTKPVMVRSVNGPEVTSIRGYQVLGTTNGDGAVRCVYLSEGATLVGFTLTNGATQSTCCDPREDGGGGVFCAGISAVVSNCVITGNSGQFNGGGAFGGTLNNCVFSANSTPNSGGGANGCTLNHCKLADNTADSGGGAYRCTMTHCTVTGNFAQYLGGGAFLCSLNNCILTGNSAVRGGAAYSGHLRNCTVTRNRATDCCGGVFGSRSESVNMSVLLENCIVTANTAPTANNYGTDSLAYTFAYTCASPLPSGLGNIDADPQFCDATSSFRLRLGSPCIDAGANLSEFIFTDIDGRPRPLDGNGDGMATFDMGAYEFDPATLATNRPLTVLREWIADDSKLHASFDPVSKGAYYILYRGRSVSHIDTPVVLKAGNCNLPELIDPIPVAAHGMAFYRIRAVPRTQPLDLDNDGIDDYYELRHASFLNPLDHADAAQDFDRDGLSNIQEYLAGSNPTRPARQALAANDHTWFALKTNGSLWFFDTNQNQLQRFGGNSNYVAVCPGGFPIATGDDWTSGSASYYFASHILALKADGSLWAWGNNARGQLGDGSTEFKMVPTVVDAPSTWSAVAAGASFSTAIKTDGSLWEWGFLTGNAVEEFTPTQVGTNHDWIDIDNSKFDEFNGYTLALKADGSLWSWGQADYGELGLGGVQSTNIPTRIGTDFDWRSFSAGAFHVVALKTDGSLWTWGSADQERSMALNTPTRIGTGTNWLAVAAGVDVSVALKTDGTLWSWKIGESPQQVGTDTDWSSPP